MCLWRLFFQPWHLTQFGPIAFSSRSLAAPRHLLFCRRRRSRTRTRPAQVRWKIGAQLDLCIRDLAAVHVAWRILHAFTKGAFVFTGTLILSFLTWTVIAAVRRVPVGARLIGVASRQAVKAH